MANIHQFIAQAEQAEQQNRWVQAAELYCKALEELPDNQQAKEQLGWCLSCAKEYKRAIGVFQELAQSQPHSAKWPYMIGYQYHEQEQWCEAIGWYEKSLKLNHNYIVVLYRKGYSHFKLAQVGEALQAFERCRTLWHALAEGPLKEKDKKNCIKATYHQAEVLIENPRKIEGAFEGAISLLGEAIKLDPQNHNVYYLLGKALLEDKQAEQAISAFQESDRIEPNQDYVLDRWGQALAALKRFEEAEQIYQRIPVGQRKGYILRNIGKIQFQEGAYQRAITTLKQALQKDGRSHYAHYYLGLCYQKTNECGLAVRELCEAVRIRQKNHNVPFPEAQKAVDEILLEHPEAANAPQMTNARQRGKVVKFNADRGFGFIQGDNGVQIFFHFKDFPRDEKIEVGMRVDYEEGVGDKGPKAVKAKRADSGKRKA
jgi:tetratricopeptide (TPR) repeat protein